MVHLKGITMSTVLNTFKNAVLYGLSAGSNILGSRRFTVGTNDEILNLHIAYSVPHLRWAEMIRIHLGHHLESIMPSAQVNFNSIALYGEEADVHQTLLSHDVLSGSVKVPGHTFIITPGWWESEMVEHAREVGVIGVPQLFCLPSTPDSIFARQDQRHNGDRRSLGGVYNGPVDPERYVHGLRAIAPGVRRVCIAYNPNAESTHLGRVTRQQVKELKAAFAGSTIKVVLHEWTDNNMGYMTLFHKMQECDAIITLHEPTALLHNDGVLAICNRLGKPLYASELNSVYQGGAIGCGVSHAAFAAPTASLIRKYVTNPDREIGRAHV